MDYVDRKVPMLSRMFEKRMQGYRAMGYEVSDHPTPEQRAKDYVIEYDEDMIPVPDIDSI